MENCVLILVDRVLHRREVVKMCPQILTYNSKIVKILSFSSESTTNSMRLSISEKCLCRGHCHQQIRDFQKLYCGEKVECHGQRKCDVIEKEDIALA